MIVTSPPVFLCDLSTLPRTGLKGAGAADFLGARGFPVPEQHNEWLAYRNGIVARLGHTEFLLESGADDWTHELGFDTLPAMDVVPILREDSSLLLGGAHVLDLFARTCSFEFAALRDRPREVVMTQMIGVSITALALSFAPTPAYRLWCDPSFGDYIAHSLAQISMELGGINVEPQQLTTYLPGYAP